MSRTKSPYKAVYAALVTRLTRSGINVGGTAGYPRIEVHSIVENEQLDKNGDIHSTSLTVETMTTDSMVTCADLNDENLQLLQEPLDLSASAWKCFGIVARQLQDLEETSDTQDSIFRLMLSVDIFTETAPEPENN